MSETYLPRPPGVAPSQPAYYQAPPLQQYQPVAPPKPNKAMRIWAWILTIFGAFLTAMYLWVYIAAQIDGVAVRSRFWVQVVIVLAMLAVGIVLFVRSKHKEPQYS